MNEFNKYVGQVFTPEWVVKETLDHISYTTNILDKKILEPAAGVGNFVLEIIRRLIKDGKQTKLDNEEILDLILKNIYAVEIDQDNYVNLIKNTIRLIEDELDIKVTIKDLKNFKATDSLKWDFETNFDFIVTNPPYTPTKFLPKNSKEYILKTFRFNNDIYHAFYERFINLLNEKGTLAFITPIAMKEDNEFINFLGNVEEVSYESNLFTAEIKTSTFIIRK